MTNQAAMDFAAAAAAALNQGNEPTRKASKKDDWVDAEVWANIGLPLPYTNPETGEVEDVFCALPKGVPFDTMEKFTPNGDNLAFNQRTEAGNMLMAHFQEVAKGLAPGESIIVPLQVELRRKKAAGVQGTAASGAHNPLVAALGQHIKLVK